MASYIQGGGYTAMSLRSQDHNNAGLQYHNRGRRHVRASARVPHSGCGYGVFVLLVLSIVSFTVIGGNYLFTFLRTHKDAEVLPQTNEFFENQDQSSLFPLWISKQNPTDRSSKMNPKWEKDIVGEIVQKREKSLQFGKPYDQKEEIFNRDSRYWDRDDRKRNKYSDYDVDDDNDDDNEDEWDEDRYGKDNQGRLTTELSTEGEETASRNGETDPAIKQETELKLPRKQSGGLYNERGRKELREYEQKLEADLEQELHHLKGKSAPRSRKSAPRSNNTELTKNHDSMQRQKNAESSFVNQRVTNKTMGIRKEDPVTEEEYSYANYDDSAHDSEQEDSQSNIGATYNVENDIELQNDNVMVDIGDISNDRGQTVMEQHVGRKTRHHQRNPCHIDFLTTTAGLKEPEPNPKFQNFSLNYIHFEDPQSDVGWEPRFAGHPTLSQRNQYFIATDQTIHCGFVQTLGISRSSGFDLTEEDMQYMSTCKIAVTSCIFGSSDNIRSPRNRKLTGSFKKDVCFVMFVDQQTLDVMKQEGQELDDKGFLDSWKVVVVKNMPYMDARRVGKIPKFLAHRLFPAARFSIWLDSKLRLQIDPVLILEYFLWRGGHEYAISNHYDRHCVWEEVQQNKKLNKYNHTAIDEQFLFYRADGLTRFNASDPKKLLPSNVPEGSFIIREHTPMSNLFSCLWFNEVDRFTSRDQLSFAYTYMKLIRMNPGKRFYLNMFKDCERKSIAKLFRHRPSGSSVLDMQK